MAVFAAGGNRPVLQHGSVGLAPSTSPAGDRPPPKAAGGRRQGTWPEAFSAPLPVLKHGPITACGENGRKRPSARKTAIEPRNKGRIQEVKAGNEVFSDPVWPSPWPLIAGTPPWE
jgi:hypothetical protein